MYCFRIGLSGAKKFQATPSRQALVPLGVASNISDDWPRPFHIAVPPSPGLQCLSFICSFFEATNSMFWRKLHQKNAELKYLSFRRLVFLAFISLNTIHFLRNFLIWILANPGFTICCRYVPGKTLRSGRLLAYLPSWCLVENGCVEYNFNATLEIICFTHRLSFYTRQFV